MVTQELNRLIEFVELKNYQNLEKEWVADGALNITFAKGDKTYCITYEEGNAFELLENGEVIIGRDYFSKFDWLKKRQENKVVTQIIRFLS